MLQEVELFVAGGGPKILSIVREVFFFLFAFLIGKGLAAFFAEGWIGQHIIVPHTRIRNERIRGRDEIIAVNVPNVV